MTRIVVATSFTAKLRGLLLAKPDDRLLVLPHCCDVHTFGMAYPLDLAFLDGSLHVLEVYRNVAPARRVRCEGAWLVVERAASPQAPWFQPGVRAGPALRRALVAALGAPQAAPSKRKSLRSKPSRRRRVPRQLSTLDRAHESYSFSTELKAAGKFNQTIRRR